MTEVSVNEIKLLPLLAVTVGDQAPIFLDENTAGELYAQLTAVLNGGEENGDTLAAEYESGWNAGAASATYQRPTVWFDYGNLGNPRTRRNVIPVTIKQGVDDVLLVGIELSKDGEPSQGTGTIKTYRTGTMGEVSEGHAVTWPAGA